MSPWELKAVNKFYQHYRFLRVQKKETQHEQKSAARRGTIAAIFHRQKKAKETVCFERKEIPATPTKTAGACSCQVPARCLWWRREARTRHTAREQRSKGKLLIKTKHKHSKDVCPLSCTGLDM